MSSFKCQGIVKEVDPFLQCQENMTLSLASKNGATCLNHYFSPLCHYLFCEIYMVERSKDYPINDECNVCSTCKNRPSA